MKKLLQAHPEILKILNSDLEKCGMGDYQNQSYHPSRSPSCEQTIAPLAYFRDWVVEHSGEDVI